MAIPRGKSYYIDFIVFDKSNLPSGRISGLSNSQFTIKWARDGDTTWTDISTEVQPSLSEIGTTGWYRFTLGTARTDVDRLSLDISVPGNTNAYVIPMSFYTVPAWGGTPTVQVSAYSTGMSPAEQVLATPANKLLTNTNGHVTTATNLDKTDYALTAAEHGNIQTDAQTAMTNQGYTTVRAPKLDNLDVAVSSRPTAADIWAHTTRTLTSFGTLVGDIWGYSTRTLTSFGTLVSDILSHTTRTLTDASNIAAAVWSYTIETYNNLARSAAWILRLLIAGLAGKVSGAENNLPVFRNIADTKNRISMTVDDDGNRTSVTLDGD